MTRQFRSLLRNTTPSTRCRHIMCCWMKGPWASQRRLDSIHAGFNVDVYGVRTEDNEPTMPPPQEYALSCAELQKLAESISRHSTDSCSLEVIPFPSTAIIDTRNHGQVEATIRIQISHERGLNQPAGSPEKCALEEVEKELKSLGIVHR